MSFVSRRVFVRSALLAAATAPLWCDVARAQELSLGKPVPFSLARLLERARTLASKPYVPPARPLPELVQKLDYEAHGQIRFKVERALDGHGPGIYPTTFFHLGRFFPKSIKMHAVCAGQARPILYSPGEFDMPADSVARKLPKDAGFAGFHVHESRSRSDWKTQDWVAFLGASYFRSIGSLNQYGLSARGIAVNTTQPGGEEFPDFTEFYIESPEHEGAPLNIYALLDGPSVTGAYRFVCMRTSGVVMDVDATLFFRTDIAQLGIAPMRSMFWYGEYDKRFRIDWRPEVHDSDGLALWTGNGERIWRPLNNPRRVITSSFSDDSPRGFGLLQRDRVADHYLDGVMYEQRPSLWVEPLGKWGPGAVQLLELETTDETNDNVAVWWLPRAPAQKGKSQRYQYRLFWQADTPYPASLATVAATRFGRGGQPGKPRPPGVTRFVVEFAGAVLEPLSQVDARVSASRGTVSGTFTELVPHTKRWRVTFDLTHEGNDAVELRAFLRSGDKTLSETWAYQFEPHD